MIKRDDAKHRARYTLEFKLEPVRLVKAGQAPEFDTKSRILPKFRPVTQWNR